MARSEITGEDLRKVHEALVNAAAALPPLPGPARAPASASAPASAPYTTGAYGAPATISAAPPTSGGAGAATEPGPTITTSTGVTFPAPTHVDTTEGTRPYNPATGAIGAVIPVPDITDNTDYSAWLDIFGFPGDVKNKVNEIFRQNPDVQRATAIAMAYIRGTDWYAATYPGIGVGMATGMIGNERDYRAYYNQINQLYRQYLGREPTRDEVSGHMTRGANPDIVSREFQGQQYVDTNRADIQYYSGAFGHGRLSEDELRQVGQDTAGLGTPHGQFLRKTFEDSVTRARRVFEGVLATPSLSLQGGRLSAPSLGAGKNEGDYGR